MREGEGSHALPLFHVTQPGRTSARVTVQAKCWRLDRQYEKPRKLGGLGDLIS